jgi:precorrin-6B methylase 2
VTKSVGGVDAGLAGEITFYKLSALLLLKTDVLLDVGCAS